MKKKLFSSFSGGKTSAFMTKWILDNLSDEYEIVVVFSNTGEEHEKTLEFVNRCDREWNFNTIWVEGVPYKEERKSTGHRVVTFETASRNGEPFEAMIEKYGIPNKSFPHCTRELKLNPMKSYLALIGWNKNYETAIGIRTDEARRARKDAPDARIVYPLIDWNPTDKQDVNSWFENQRFNLEIEEHQGNCKWCWKKSFSKHFKLIAQSPKIYEFPRRMEQLHGRTGTGSKNGLPRVFFRLETSTDTLFKSAAIGRLADDRQLDLNLNGGCSESCEVYEMGEEN